MDNTPLDAATFPAVPATTVPSISVPDTYVPTTPVLVTPVTVSDVNETGDNQVFKDNYVFSEDLFRTINRTQTASSRKANSIHYEMLKQLSEKNKFTIYLENINLIQAFIIYIISQSIGYLNIS